MAAICWLIRLFFSHITTASSPTHVFPSFLSPVLLHTTYFLSNWLLFHIYFKAIGERRTKLITVTFVKCRKECWLSGIQSHNSWIDGPRGGRVATDRAIGARLGVNEVSSHDNKYWSFFHNAFRIIPAEVSESVHNREGVNNMNLRLQLFWREDRLNLIFLYILCLWIIVFSYNKSCL